MLIAAIPATVVYKMVTGRAPLPAEPTIFETGDYKTIFQQLSGSPPVAVAAGHVRVHDRFEREGADTAEPEPELSRAARIYSIIGGVIYPPIAIAEGILGLSATVMEASALSATDIEKMMSYEHKALSLDTWKCGMGLAKLPFAFPVGSAPEVGLQRGVWGVSLAAVLLEGVVMILSRRGNLGKAISGKVKGGLTLLKGLTVFTLENVIFWKYERDATGGTGAHQADADLKYAQNWFYFGSEMAGGVGALIPGMNNVKGGILLGSGAAVVVGSVFDFARLVLNVHAGVAHHNF
jgi:hypothetical protein